MTVRTYRSTDTGSPGGITRGVGELLTVLDACLINGYTLDVVISVVRISTTVTVTFASDHELQGNNFITMSGMVQSEYNGEFEATITGADTVSYEIVGSPITPATGSPSAAKSGSGWVAEFTAVNRSTYKQADGFSLYVDDTTTLSARAIGFENMTDIDTGTGEFPTTSQLNGGTYFPKGSSVSVIREWIVVATENAFYYWINYADILTSAPCCFFGKFNSYKAADSFNILLAAGTGNGFSSGNGVAAVVSSLTGSSPGSYIPRAHDQNGSSISCGRFSDYASSIASAYCGDNGTDYPDQITLNLNYADVYINETTNRVRRGIMPGLLNPLHDTPLTHLDTFEGSGDYSGKKFLVLNCFSSAQIFLEISNTW